MFGRKKKEEANISNPLTNMVVVRPQVKLDIKKVKTPEDIILILEALDITLPKSAVSGKEVERLFDMSKFVNTRSEKLAIVAHVQNVPYEHMAGYTDEQIDAMYVRVCTDENIVGVIRQ